jgi:hypothetical protein
MTRLVVLQHLEPEGPGLFAAEAGRRGWPTWAIPPTPGWRGKWSWCARPSLSRRRWGAQVARQGERLIANLLDLLTADLVGR